MPGEQPKNARFIKLNTNENPYPPSPAVIEAVQKAADEKLRLYPDPECSELREAAAARYSVDSGQVFAGNGSDEILAFAFGAFFEREIYFPDITYSFYPVYADLWCIPRRAIPLRDDFSVNINDYKDSPGGAVLPNPNAPTGIALPLQDILSLAGFMNERGNVFIADEAYTAFGALSAVPYIDEYPNLLTVHTLSKSASLAGLRAGFAIGSVELIEGLRRIRDSFNSYTMDRLALAGAVAAVKDEKYYDEISRKIISTRTRVTEALRKSGFYVLPSSANFIFIKHPGISGGGFFSELRKKGVLVRHFNRDRIADFLRVSIGTDDDMDIFLNACENILGEYNENYQK